MLLVLSLLSLSVCLSLSLSVSYYALTEEWCWLPQAFFVPPLPPPLPPPPRGCWRGTKGLAERIVPRPAPPRGCRPPTPPDELLALLKLKCAQSSLKLYSPPAKKSRLLSEDSSSDESFSSTDRDGAVAVDAGTAGAWNFSTSP